VDALTDNKETPFPDFPVSRSSIEGTGKTGKPEFPEKAENGNFGKASGDTKAAHWNVHFSNRGPSRVSYSPAVDQRRVFADYPSAAAVEVAAPPASREPTEAEAAELRGMIEAVYRGEPQTEIDEALAAGLADIDAALTCYHAITKGL
jgi:hypothetical protein